MLLTRTLLQSMLGSIGLDDGMVHMLMLAGLLPLMDTVFRGLFDRLWKSLLALTKSISVYTRRHADSRSTHKLVASFNYRDGVTYERRIPPRFLAVMWKIVSMLTSSSTTAGPVIGFTATDEIVINGMSQVFVVFDNPSYMLCIDGIRATVELEIIVSNQVTERRYSIKLMPGKGGTYKDVSHFIENISKEYQEFEANKDGGLHLYRLEGYEKSNGEPVFQKISFRYTQCKYPGYRAN